MKTMISIDISTLPGLRLMTHPPLDMPGMLKYFIAVGQNLYPNATSAVLLWKGEAVAGWGSYEG